VKNQLSRYLALVRRGTEALAGLERKGLVRRGSGSVPREILDRNPPGRTSGVLRALLEERRRR